MNDREIEALSARSAIAAPCDPLDVSGWRTPPGSLYVVMPRTRWHCGIRQRARSPGRLCSTAFCGR